MMEALLNLTQLHTENKRLITTATNMEKVDIKPKNAHPQQQIHTDTWIAHTKIGIQNNTPSRLITTQGHPNVVQSHQKDSLW